MAVGANTVRPFLVHQTCVIPHMVYVFTNHVGESVQTLRYPHNGRHNIACFFSIVINQNHVAPNGRTVFAPTVICADITSMNRQKWAVEGASPYTKVLPPQNRFARCFLCFVLTFFSVRLCHSSLLTPHFAHTAYPFLFSNLITFS